MPVKQVEESLEQSSKEEEDCICLIRRWLMLRERTTMRCVRLVGCHRDTEILEFEDQSVVSEDRVSTKEDPVSLVKGEFIFVFSIANDYR